MQKRVALISGGGGYLGSAIAAALHAAGWEVAALSRAMDAPYRCDITRDEEVEAAVAKAVERFGRVDACIHAASPRLAHDKAAEVVQMRTAVVGAQLLAKYALPHMASGGAFVGITSKLAESGITTPPLGFYVAAKKALREYLRELASELHAKGIRVYAVAPGYMAGGLNKGVPDTMLDILGEKTGAGRTNAEDVAALVETICVKSYIYPSGSSVSIPPIICAPL